MQNSNLQMNIRKCFLLPSTLLIFSTLQLIERHISNKTVISCGITPDSIYTIGSKQSEPIKLYKNGLGTIWVNSYAKVLSADKIALNGVLMKIDRVLACENCQRP